MIKHTKGARPAEEVDPTGSKAMTTWPLLNKNALAGMGEASIYILLYYGDFKAEQRLPRALMMVDVFKKNEIHSEKM